MTPDINKPLKVFCSYSHKDEEHVNDMRDWLRGLERQGLIEWWHDREISPGWEWEEAIDKNLRTADVILLLVSRAFMASDYVYEREIGVAVERHERGEARVIPIIVRPADWEWASFGKLQALPKDAKPITTWPDWDEAWLDVVRGVRRAVEELLLERQKQAAKERYRKVVGELWVDNTVSDAEAERLGALASELSLSMDAVADIEREVMGDTREAILERQEQAAREIEGLERRKRLDERYTEARRLHRDRNWQAVVDVFEQIHAEDPNYSDQEGLLTSAREALEIQKLARRVATTYEQGVRHVDGQEWQQALRCFEEIQRLKPGYKDTEMLLSQVRRELGTITVENAGWIRLLRTLKVRDGGVENPSWIRRLQGVDRKYSRTIRSVAFSPDGQLLASAVSWTYPEERGRTGTVELWDVEGGKLLRTLGGYFNKVSSVAFSPDGQLLASIGGLGESAVSPQLWQVEGWELLCTLERQVDEDNNVGIEIGKSVTFSSEGRLLASSAGDHTVQLWGLA